MTEIKQVLMEIYEFEYRDETFLIVLSENLGSYESDAGKKINDFLEENAFTKRNFRLRF